jgi:hypothetical protein
MAETLLRQSMSRCLLRFGPDLEILDPIGPESPQVVKKSPRHRGQSITSRIRRARTFKFGKYDSAKLHFSISISPRNPQIPLVARGRNACQRTCVSHNSQYPLAIVLGSFGGNEHTPLVIRLGILRTRR